MRGAQAAANAPTLRALRAQVPWARVQAIRNRQIVGPVNRHLVVIVLASSLGLGCLRTASSAPADAMVDGIMASDAGIDVVTRDGALASCSGEYFYIDAVLDDGRRFERCLPLRALDWNTRNCMSSSVGATSGGDDVSASIVWTSGAPGEPPPLERVGELAMGGILGVSSGGCGAARETCPASRESGCCVFGTFLQTTCRWAVRQAAGVGAVAELGLIAPCEYRGRVPDDAGMPGAPGSVRLLHAYVRGVVRHQEFGILVSHADVPLIPDCGF